MSERSLTRKGRLTAIYMLVFAIVVIGLALAGVLQTSGPRSPMSQVVAK
jgi:hypothetical protein